MEGKNLPSDAGLSYLASVKKAFLAEPEKYQEFLNTCRDHLKNPRPADLDYAIVKMEELFKDHKELLLRFIFFLPPHAKIPPQATASCALKYVLTVREAFRAEPLKYDQFLKLLQDYESHKLDVDGFITKVEELMKDHQNLLVGLLAFLPEAQRTLSPEAEQRAANFLAKLKGNNLEVFESFCEILEQFKEGKLEVYEVYVELLELLELDHDDLVMELPEFFGGRPLEVAKYIRRLSQL